MGVMFRLVVLEWFEGRRDDDGFKCKVTSLIRV